MTGRPFACQPVARSRRTGHLVQVMSKDKDREERLAAALRENLRRRKAQSRELDAEEKTDQRKD
jgi:hypothetical protein